MDQEKRKKMRVFKNKTRRREREAFDVQGSQGERARGGLDPGAGGSGDSLGLLRYGGGSAFDEEKVLEARMETVLCWATPGLPGDPFPPGRLPLSKSKAETVLEDQRPFNTTSTQVGLPTTAFLVASPSACALTLLGTRIRRREWPDLGWSERKSTAILASTTHPSLWVPPPPGFLETCPGKGLSCP